MGKWDKNFEFLLSGLFLQQLPLSKEQSTQPKWQGKENYFVVAVAYCDIASNDKEYKPGKEKYYLK